MSFRSWTVFSEGANRRMDSIEDIVLDIPHEDSEMVLRYLVDTGVVTLLQLRSIPAPELQSLIRQHYRSALKASLSPAPLKSRKVRISSEMDAETKRKMQQLLQGKKLP